MKKDGRDKAHKVWEIYTDGASSMEGAGVGVMVVSPQGVVAHVDSLLVANQINGVYEVKEERMRVASVDTMDNNGELRRNLDVLEERRERAALEEESRAGEQGKMGPNWEGPYMVHEVLGKGAYSLALLDGSKQQGQAKKEIEAEGQLEQAPKDLEEKQHESITNAFIGIPGRDGITVARLPWLVGERTMPERSNLKAKRKNPLTWDKGSSRIRKKEEEKTSNRKDKIELEGSRTLGREGSSKGGVTNFDGEKRIRRKMAELNWEEEERKLIKWMLGLWMEEVAPAAEESSVTGGQGAKDVEPALALGAMIGSVEVEIRPGKVEVESEATRNASNKEPEDVEGGSRAASEEPEHKDLLEVLIKGGKKNQFQYTRSKVQSQDGKYYNARVHPEQFNPRDLVLHKNEARRQEALRKMGVGGKHIGRGSTNCQPWMEKPLLDIGMQQILAILSIIN
ncbi:hypothetical protein E3N88_28396 [Mikania micrantha]|uniref:Uncharacterized protein n=1 Tax=Mikania micrantha TaxID=192012 RepID=A0A5N6N278_9ASTR|nr:hypothetical protein E3N88_28396 [Mikania micrantha]